MAYGQIYARPLPPVERMGRMKELIREPDEAPYIGGLDTLRAAKLLKEAQTPVVYTPRSLAQAAEQVRLPVPSSPQRPIIEEEEEEVITAQAGGRAAIPQQIENLASKGRHGDTMLMHVNPDELKGLSSLLGPTTTNPDTGLPEAFAWWLPLIGAALGGIATGSWKGAALGGLAGLGGAGLGMAFGAPGSIWTTAAGPFSGMLSGAGAGATGLAGGTGVGAAQGLYGPYAAAMQGAGTGAALGGVGTAASTIPSVFNANQIAAINAAQGSQALSSVPHTMGMGWGPGVTPTTPIPITPITTPTYGQQMGTWPTNLAARGVTSRGAPMKQGVNTWEKAAEFSQGAGETPSDLLTSGAFDTGGEGAMATESAIPWWKKGIEWAKKHPIETGLGALGATALLSQPRQQQIADLPIKEVSEFTFEEKDPRIPKTFTQAELEEAAEVGPVPSFFAKEGGLLSVIKRQGGSTLSGISSMHPAIISAGPQAVAQEVERQNYGNRYPTSAFGNPQTRAVTHPLIIDALSQRSDWPSSWGGIGAGGGNSGIPATVVPPFEFPEVTPFRSVAPFSSSDRLATITGQPTTPVDFSQVTVEDQFVPSTNIPDVDALSDLFSRFEQAQGDPIIDLVTSTEAIPAQKGGLLGLANGGIPNVFAGHVRGVGDGMSDQIPFRVVPQTPQDIPKAPDMAVLSTDEYVFPADAVSMLGNGSSDAGAKILDNAVKSVRRASIGTPKQITEIDGQKVLGRALTT